MFHLCRTNFLFELSFFFLISCKFILFFTNQIEINLKHIVTEINQFSSVNDNKIHIFSYKSKFGVLTKVSLEAFQIPDIFLKLASGSPSMHPSVQPQPKILHGPFPQNIPIISPPGFLPSPQTFAKHRSGRLVKKKNENVQH